MRYNARKRLSIYVIEQSFGDYGESVLVERLVYSGTQLVCPMTSKIVKQEYGITANNPKKIIFNRPLPMLTNKESLFIELGDKRYKILERTDFDKFNILLIDER